MFKTLGSMAHIGKLHVKHGYRKALNKVVRELVNDGYDDIGVAYCVHDKSLLS
jgi:hypothetical protein